MNIVKLTVTDADPDVPGTGAFTADIVSGMGGIGIGVLIAVLIAGTVTMGVVLRKRAVRSYDGRKGGFRIGDKGKKIGGLFSILLLVTALAVPLATGGENVNQVFADEGDTELTITADNIDMTLKKKTNSVMNGQYSTSVIINSSTTAGYVLGLYASSADLMPTTSGVTTKLSGLTGSTATTLSKNTWGVSLTEKPNAADSVWYAVPTTKDSALILVNKTSGTEAGDSTDIVYGFSVGDDMDSGEYSTTITYVATANVTTP